MLGDSISRGVVLGEGQKRYRFSADRFVSKLQATIEPSFVDCSKYGSTTGYGLSLLDRKFPDGMPDLVFIQYGSNDSDYDWPAVARDPEGWHEPKIALEKYARNLRALVSRVRAAGSIPILSNLHPLVPHKYFAWFTKGDAPMRKSVLRWLRSEENIYWWQEMYSYVAVRTANELDVPLIRVREAFLRRPGYEDLLCEDGIHPNAEGHDVIFGTIMDRIQARAPSWLKGEAGSALATNGQAPERAR